MTIQNIPLEQLRPCPNNVRKTGGTSIDDLAASIRAHGLLQNLTVRKNGKGFEVSAGARRLRALLQLEKAGDLPPTIADEGVPCLVVDDAIATEAGLAENTLREAMHPADEFVALHGLVEHRKLTPAEIGERFGKTEKYVEQRLRLGNVAPKLLDEYRAGNANLEQMMALAIVDDHAAQEKAWKAGERSNYYRMPNQLRDALVDRDVSLRSPLGKLVGVEAYEAAGGTARRDLFSDFVTLPDSKLVQKLAKGMFDAEAAVQRKKGWGWVEVKPEFDYAARSKYRQAGSKAPSDKLGAVITIGDNGKVEVVAGLVKPGEKAPAEVAAGAKKKAAGAKVDKRVTETSLVGIQTGVLQAALYRDTGLALRVLAATLAADYLNEREPVTGVLYAEFGAYAPASLAPWIKVACPGGEAEGNSWEKRVKEGAKKAGSILAWLRSQPDDVVLSLLAFLATDALCTEDCDEGVHDVARELGVDFATAWTITSDWLSKQPKTYVLEAVTEAAGKDVAKAIEKGKAKDFFADAHTTLVERGWVPEQLRAPEPKKPAAKKAAKKAKR